MWYHYDITFISFCQGFLKFFSNLLLQDILTDALHPTPHPSRKSSPPSPQGEG